MKTHQLAGIVNSYINAHVFYAVRLTACLWHTDEYRIGNPEDTVVCRATHEYQPFLEYNQTLE